MNKENTPSAEGTPPFTPFEKALSVEMRESIEKHIQGSFDLDDDFDEPLPERTCNLDDEECESCS